MKEVIFVHAGLSKTGTTALQGFLSANREPLAGLGYYIPVSGLRRNQHYFLSSSLRTDSESYLEHAHWDLLHEELEARSESRVILSSEGFSKIENVILLRDMLHSVCHRVVTVFYFRRQDEWLKALYKTWVKDVRRFNGSLSLYLKCFDAHHRARCDYLARAQKWAGVWPAEQIKTRPYRHVTETTGIVNDFLDLVGITPEQRKSMTGIDVRTHVSAPDLATDLIARLNNLPSLPGLQWKIAREIQNIAVRNGIGTGWTTRSCAYSGDETRYVREQLSRNNPEFVSRFMKLHGGELLDSSPADALQLPEYEEDARIAYQEQIVDRLEPALRDHVRAMVRRAGAARAGEVPLPGSELELLTNANNRLSLEMQWLRLSVSETAAESLRLRRDRNGSGSSIT